MDEALSKNLAYLPTDVITNILTRLPVRTIIICKCVCKPLFKLIGTSDFSKFYHSKSGPGLTVYQVDNCSNLFRTFQYNYELCDIVPVTSFERKTFIRPPRAIIEIEGSVNGLLLLRNTCGRLHYSICISNPLYICNPITREYINLPSPQGILHGFSGEYTCGFGVSKKTDLYKVVLICQLLVRDDKSGSCLRSFKSACHVYTLGTGSWRGIPLGSSYAFNNQRLKSVFLNGNLYWLVLEVRKSMLISCFDLETELFKVLSPPAPYCSKNTKFVGDVGVLRDRLCLCDNTSGDEIAIWVMKESAWTKEIVISKLHGRASEWGKLVYPIKVFKDGGMLLLWGCSNLVYYSSEDKTTKNVTIFGLGKCVTIDASLHTWSFLSLKSFAMEDVAKFSYN